MANIMGILGGLGQGVSAGVQDLERMEDAKFRKEQQQREREKIAEEKRIAEQIKGIQAETPAEYDESMSTITKPAQKLSRSQMLARQADIYSASPDRATAAYGLQLSQAARGEKEAEDFQAAKAEHEANLKAIQEDPDKWQQKYTPEFNADRIGGPSTKGFMVAPMSMTDGSKVLNVLSPQGQIVQRIPVNRDALTRTAKAMYYAKLEGINPKYAELAMKQEQIDLQRKAGESEAEYRSRTAATGEAREARETSEMGLRAPVFAAQARQANANADYLGRKPTSKADQIKEDIDARAQLLFEAYPNKYKNVAAARLDAVREVTKTGLRPGTKLIENRDEGGGTIVDENNKALYNRLPNGYDVPIGVTNSSYIALEKEAKNKGVILRPGTDANGNPALRYTKDDKTFFRTIEEARKSK